MLDRNGSRAAKFGVAVVIVIGAVFAVAHVNRRATLRGYVWFERQWSEHWPTERGKSAVRDALPALCRAGLLAPARVKVQHGISFLLDPRDLVSRTILISGEWQPEVWDSIAPNLSDGAVFLDVGAHIGYFSMLAARQVGQTGKVVAFEPNPETLKLLRDNVTANHAANVVVEPVACTDREQALTLYTSAGFNTGAASLARENADISASEPPRPYPVRGRPIDDVVRELNLTRVDAIKIDVEGAEVSVLKGAVDTMKRFHPKIVTEVVREQLASFKTTPGDVQAVLKGAGYTRSKRLDETDWEWTVEDARYMASTIRMSDRSKSDQLIRGFHVLEENSWRWTDGKFAVQLRTPPGAGQNGARLVLKFVIPEVVLKELKSTTLSVSVANTALAPQTYERAGELEYRGEVPASALGKDFVEADFALDKFLRPSKTDPRELGVLVTSVGLEGK